MAQCSVLNPRHCFAITCHIFPLFIPGRFARLSASRTLHSLGANLVILSCGLLTSVIISRSLGPVGRGEIAAALLWPVLLTTFASFGVTQGILYLASGHRQPFGTVAGTALVFSALQSAAAICIGYVAIPHLLGSQTNDVIRYSRLYLAVAPLMLLTNYGWGLLQAHLRLSAYNALRVVTPVGYLAGATWLWLAGALTLETVVLLQLLLSTATLVLTLAALVAGAKPATTRSVRFSCNTARSLVAYGGRVQLGELTRTANVQLDQILISAWLPPAQLGLYMAAFAVGGMMQILGKAARPVLMAKVANAGDAHAGYLLYKQTMLQVGKATLFILPLALAAIPFLLPLVYGAGFADAVPAALGLALAGTILGAVDIAGGAAQAAGDPWLSSQAELLGVAVTIAVLPLALLQFGILGAALASVLAYSAQLLTLLTGLRRQFMTADLSVN